MAMRFHHSSKFTRFAQQVRNIMKQRQNPNRRKLFGGFRRRKPYSAIATLAFALFRWLFLFCMGMALLVLFAAFTVSSGVAGIIFAGVMPVIRLFGSITFLVFAIACIKESI